MQLQYEELQVQQNPRKTELCDLLDYDRIIISTSGGKDSLAAVLYLLDLGIPRERLLLWHQCIDGRSNPFMDWPVTESYCQAMSTALDIPIEWQWRENGFYGEMMRTDEVSKSICYEISGKTITLPTIRGIPSTRRKFPAKSADLKKRWCSAYLKIDVFRRVLNNHPDYKEGQFLVITGERREESLARSRYLETEIHPCNNRRRQVHWWRNVIDWEEEEIWAIIEKHRIQPHPAYMLGWNRTSCFGCIFQTPDLWAMMREIAPERFNLLAKIEQELNFTIDNKRILKEMADAGKSRIPKNMETSKWVRKALEGTFNQKEFFVDKWELPTGAFKGVEGGSY